MRGFQANNCRLCQKVFCCKECRIKHEKNTHNIFPDCDICIYGKFCFTNFDDQFLQHLECSHLPVHCVYCKKVFSSVEDLLQHKKCNYFHAKEHSPTTPFKGTPVNPAILLPTDDNNSPILQELQRQEYFNYILATSTPMQRGEEHNLMFEKGKEVITPVDKPHRVANKSIIKKTDSVKSDEQLSKRRVTFGDTPAHTFEKNTRENTGNQEITPSKFLEGSSDGESLNPKSNVNFTTPAIGMSTATFYSAKSDNGQFYSAKRDISFEQGRDKCNIKDSVEDFTPVGIPNRSKLINVKGDIYKNQDREINCLTDREECIDENKMKIEDNLTEVSMELCTPAKHLNSLGNLVNNQDDSDKEPINNISLITNSGKGTEDNKTNDAINFCTPAKTSNPGKIIVKADIYKDCKKDNISQIAESTKENEDSIKDDYKNKSEGGLETKKNLKTEAEGHDTLWVSAFNLEDTDNDMEQQNDENSQPVEKSKPTQYENNLLGTPVSPPSNGQRRVSIVMPTPILKTTKVQMKFHFPAHLSSTPIMSSGALKINQTKTVQEISSRIIQHKTPYKAPQGKLAQRKLLDVNHHQNFVSLPDIEAGPSTAGREAELLENLKDDHSASDAVIPRDIARETINEQYEDTYASLPSQEPETGISVSSMTESNLWTSMTRIVRSVFGGFSSVSQYSNDTSIKSNTSSFKRQLSDSDTGEFLEAPFPKRFKFTDIKCRRSIRNLRALELPYSLPAPTASSATSIEIIKSVSTLYGHQTMRIQYDKATQTDNYLMYGWHPHF